MMEIEVLGRPLSGLAAASCLTLLVVGVAILWRLSVRRRRKQRLGPEADGPASSNASFTLLSPRLMAKLSKMFAPNEAERAAAMLATEASGLERVRSAVLKLSEGSLEKLAMALQLAKTDWRDALTAAGFGHDLQSHEAWLSE